MVRSKLILVAGMHRSGTSALTRALNLAGLPLPGNLLEPLPANPDGYWEPVDVILLHNRMLESLGSCWDDFRAIPRAWFAGAEAAAFAAELGRWIEGEMGGGGALLVKDPRICRFLPLWAAVCGRLNIDVHAILAVRNPLEVVASLERRNKFPAIKSALLWSRYFIDA